MTRATEEIVAICESLPESRRAEVMDFARFLLAREGEEAWERELETAKARPRLEAFLRSSAAEGDEPLDQGRL
ncbi:MAG TPA: hypothetical protein VHQ47_13080 [Phycisphaerae bacterium]|nr:hypothetical protein [Phycisphaerae bacterium]